MKRGVFIIFFLLTYFLAYSHSIRMAVFAIDKEEGQYQLFMNFDRDDLVKSVNLSYQCKTGTAIPFFMIEEYLSEHFQLAINGNCTPYTIDQVDLDEQYLKVYALINFQGSRVTKIDIYNTCLIDYNEGHMNIVRSSLNELSRSFRLSLERIQTVIQY